MLTQTEAPGYFKDVTSGAIINTNDSEYMKILERRKEIKKGKDLCKRISNLELEIREIRNLLTKIALEYSK